MASSMTDKDNSAIEATPVIDPVQIQLQLFKELHDMCSEVIHITTEYYKQYSEMGAVTFINVLNQVLKIKPKVVRFAPELFSIVSDAFKGIKNTTWLHFFAPDDQQVIDYTNKLRAEQGLQQIPRIFDAPTTDCTICNLPIVKTISLDCGHIVCYTCSMKIQKCPFCRANIDPMRLAQSGQFVSIRQTSTQVPQYTRSNTLPMCGQFPTAAKIKMTYPYSPYSLDLSRARPPQESLPLDMSFKPCQHIGVDNDDIKVSESASAQVQRPQIKSLIQENCSLIDFKVFENLDTPTCTDWIVTLDVSGSMHPHFDNMMKTMIEFVQNMRPLDRICIIVFSTVAVQLFPLSHPSSELLTKITRNCVFGACTNYKIAAELTLKTIQEAQTRNSERQTMCVFITDGEASDQKDGYPAIREIIQQPRTSSLVCSFGSGIQYAKIEEILCEYKHLYRHYEAFPEFGQYMNKLSGVSIAISNIQIKYTNENGKMFVTQSKDLYSGQSYQKFIQVPFVPTKLSIKWIQAGVEYESEIPTNSHELSDCLSLCAKKTEVEQLQEDLGKSMSASPDPKQEIEVFKQLSNIIVEKIMLIPDMSIRDYLMSMQKSFIDNIEQIANPICLPAMARSLTTSTSNRVMSTQMSQ